MNIRQIHDLPKEILDKIFSNLNLKDIYHFSLINKFFFKFIKKLNIKDPYLRYILLSISEAQPMLSEARLKNIYLKNNKIPLLINYGKKIFVYQPLLKTSIHELDPDAALQIIVELRFSRPSINGYKRICMLDENECINFSNIIEAMKKSTLLLSLKKNGTLHIIGHHPKVIINQTIFFDKENPFHERLPAVYTVSGNMQLLYDIFIISNQDFRNEINKSYSQNLTPLFKWENNMLVVLKKYASFIKFKNILKLNREGKSRLDRINKLKFKHNHTFFNCMLNYVLPIETAPSLSFKDLLHSFGLMESMSLGKHELRTDHYSFSFLFKFNFI